MPPVRVRAPTGRRPPSREARFGQRRRLGPDHHAGQPSGEHFAAAPAPQTTDAERRHRAGRPRPSGRARPPRPAPRAGRGSRPPGAPGPPGRPRRARRDALRRRSADPAHRRSPSRTTRRRAALQATPRPRSGRRRGAHAHPVATRVGDERLGRPEAHRLGVEQRRGERGGVVALEPRRAVDEVRERHRVRSGNPKFANAASASKTSSATAPETPRSAIPRTGGPQPHHPQLGALRRHRLAQLVGLGGAETRDGDRHLHQLLLEQRHPERALAGSARAAGAGT